MTKTTKRRQPKAKNAYELLQRVCAHIKAEPLTYDQGDWFKVSAANQEDVMGATTDCGTVWCCAGWIVALNDGHREARRLGIGGMSIAGRARAILTADNEVDVLRDDISDLFNGDACGLLSPGTREYVSVGIKGIRAFMAKHRTYLKARTLRGI